MHAWYMASWAVLMSQRCHWACAGQLFVHTDEHQLSALREPPGLHKLAVQGIPEGAVGLPGVTWPGCWSATGWSCCNIGMHGYIASSLQACHAARTAVNILAGCAGNT